MILSVKFIKKITSRLLVVIMIILGFFCVKGYNLYSDTIKQTPIEDIADNIQSQDNFTYYDELPQIYIDAVISAEDKRFEKHFGIDLFAISRAAWTDIKTFSFAEGGSTITQQIAKNLLFTQEKKLERKFAEIFAAFALEKSTAKKNYLKSMLIRFISETDIMEFMTPLRGTLEKNRLSLPIMKLSCLQVFQMLLPIIHQTII